ncbi:MAG: cytochrome c [Betaproteobacteria bacterium]|nr:cytochrome c [Betaproteobacteria bacterium]MDH4326586.1 cytochrome c [Betaproteobacteria bacterium]MDH5210698.1 cytochrome c [Betaproteobacteria bacterium]
MMSKLANAGMGVVLGMMVAQGAFAQAKPEVLVKQRQAKMILQGKYFGPMAAMAQGKVAYNAAVVQRNAGFLDNLTRMAWDGYDPSTKGEKSRTLPAAYEDSAKFNEYVSRMENEAAKLVALSKGGDEAAVKAQIGAVGKVCGGCHDDFRSK